MKVIYGDRGTLLIENRPVPSGVLYTSLLSDVVGGTWAFKELNGMEFHYIGYSLFDSERLCGCRTIGILPNPPEIPLRLVVDGRDKL